jgi:hypothetical protein
MKYYIPFLVRISGNTLEVLQTAGNKLFSGPEDSAAYFGEIPDGCSIISVGDYRNYKNKGFTIIRIDLL